MPLKIIKPEIVKKDRTVKPQTSIMFPDKTAWGFLFPSILMLDEKIAKQEIDLAMDALITTPSVNLYLETLKMCSKTQDDIVDEIFFQINISINGQRFKRFGACMPGASMANIYEAMQNYIILVGDELGYYFD
jgi:hypothetical protein